MPNDTALAIECTSVNPGFVVPDISQAIEYYTQRLGFKFDFDWGEPPRFAGVRLGSVSLHLMKGVETGKGFAYFVVEDVDELYDYHKSNDVEIVEPIANREYSMRDYHIRDFCGNMLGFGKYVMISTPELKIERVELPVRLERRLAALLKDLAEHKGMSVDSTLEETLLHTFEQTGDGVVSPHTKTTLRYIQELKKKHGIDYDVHASYRFVE
jgi:catechol 2,3-dioxygenase-like lactoylglutathione lyase family enzyme